MDYEKKIKELEDQIAALQEENEQLRSVITGKDVDIKLAAAQCEDAHQEYEQLLKELCDIRDQYQEVLKRVHELRERYREEMETQIAAVRAAYQDTKDE